MLLGVVVDSIQHGLGAGIGQAFVACYFLSVSASMLVSCLLLLARKA